MRRDAEGGQTQDPLSLDSQIVSIGPMLGMQHAGGFLSKPGPWIIFSDSKNTRSVPAISSSAAIAASCR